MVSSPSLDLNVKVSDLPGIIALASPDSKAILESLFPLHDEIKLKSGRLITVAPLENYITDGVFPPQISVWPIQKGKVAEKAMDLEGKDLESWRPLENLTLQAVDKLLALKTKPEIHRLRLAQKTLVVVLKFHIRHRQRPSSGPDPWKGFREQLENRLRNVRLELLQNYLAQVEKTNTWNGVLEMTRQMSSFYPAENAVAERALQVFLQYADYLIKTNHPKQARSVLLELERGNLNNPRVQALRQRLHQEAEKKFQAAKSNPNAAEAISRLEEVLAFDPQLPGAGDELLKRQGKYKILYVGVPELPKMLSPALAHTEVEKQALDLLFESLLVSRYTNEAGQTFSQELGNRQSTADRELFRFTLPADAFWSDGSRLTSGDIRHTVELLRQPNLPGRSAVWKELFESPRVGKNPLEVEFRMKLGIFQPLSFFTFPVVPETYQGKVLFPAELESFARKPIGSGPYRYQGLNNDGQRVYAAFTANPYFARNDRPLQPEIREIRLYVPRDPVADYLQKENPAFYLTCPSAEELALWQQNGVRNLRTIRNQRVYFLAVNHRNQILQNRQLRLALATSLQRSAILDHCFRGGDSAYSHLEVAGAGLALSGDWLGKIKSSAHRQLNGPFPPNSWAIAPPARVPSDLFDLDRAKSYFKIVKEEIKSIKLRLAYPIEDPRIQQACREMIIQWTKVAKEVRLDLKVELVPLPMSKLWEAVYRHDYELAYFHWDFPDIFYRLQPLFDPRPDATAPGGSNFLGYANDGTLVTLLRTSANHHDLQQVIDLTQDIHAHLHERMPMIPLWQIDSQLAIHPNLEVGALDPLRPFKNVALWKMKAE